MFLKLPLKFKISNWKKNIPIFQIPIKKYSNHLSPFPKNTPKFRELKKSLKIVKKKITSTVQKFQQYGTYHS